MERISLPPVPELTVWDLIGRSLKKGSVTIIAGRPGMGKTALILSMARYFSKEKRVAVFTQEQSKKTLFQEGFLLPQWLKDSEDIRLEDRKDIAARKGLMLLDDPTFSSFDIVRWRDTNYADMLFIDSLRHLIFNDRIRSTLQNLTEFAKEKRITILITSQLARKPEQRRNHRPRITDLIYADTILQEVDTVLLLHRDHYYNIGEDEALASCSVYNSSGKKLRQYPLKWCRESLSFENPNFEKTRMEYKTPYFYRSNLERK